MKRSALQSTPAARPRLHGLSVEQVRLDLETAKFPWPDASVDVIVCNQVFEHLKNIWLPMSEIHRVLAPGGWLLLSVPNLGSLHNRMMLGLGLQPTSIRTLGPHVRGYTAHEIRRYLVTSVSSRERFSVRSESAGTGASSIQRNIASTMRRHAVTWRSMAEPQYRFDQPAPASQPAMPQQNAPVPSIIQPSGPLGLSPVRFP